MSSLRVNSQAAWGAATEAAARLVVRLVVRAVEIAAAPVAIGEGRRPG